MYEQISLFDLMDKQLCIDCPKLIKRAYLTENKIMDRCSVTGTFIDRALTSKEGLCKNA